MFHYSLIYLELIREGLETWIIKTKNLSVEKERSIDSKAQKKTNEITKFRINAFL